MNRMNRMDRARWRNLRASWTESGDKVASILFVGRDISVLTTDQMSGRHGALVRSRVRDRHPGLLVDDGRDGSRVMLMDYGLGGSHAMLVDDGLGGRRAMLVDDSLGGSRTTIERVNKSRGRHLIPGRFCLRLDGRVDGRRRNFNHRNVMLTATVAILSPLAASSLRWRRFDLHGVGLRRRVLDHDLQLLLLDSRTGLGVSRLRFGTRGRTISCHRRLRRVPRRGSPTIRHDQRNQMRERVWM